MKFKFRYVLIGLAVILLPALADSLFGREWPWAGRTGFSCVGSGAQVDVSESGGGVIVFEPTDAQPPTGFIFYPVGAWTTARMPRRLRGLRPKVI